jgi:hypothetical protein
MEFLGNIWEDDTTFSLEFGLVWKQVGPRLFFLGSVWNLYVVFFLNTQTNMSQVPTLGPSMYVGSKRTKFVGQSKWLGQSEVLFGTCWGNRRGTSNLMRTHWELDGNNKKKKVVCNVLIHPGPLVLLVHQWWQTFEVMLWNNTWPQFELVTTTCRNHISCVCLPDFDAFGCGRDGPHPLFILCMWHKLTFVFKFGTHVVLCNTVLSVPRNSWQATYKGSHV